MPIQSTAYEEDHGAQCHLKQGGWSTLALNMSIAKMASFWAKGARIARHATSHMGAPLKPCRGSAVDGRPRGLGLGVGSVRLPAPSIRPDISRFEGHKPIASQDGPLQEVEPSMCRRCNNP